MKKYHVIYADPPWRYNDRRNTDTRFRGGAMQYYPVMTIKDIQNLPVHLIAEDNAVLFLWVTMPLLPEGLETIKSWGFTYKTVGFSWHKINKDGSLRLGIGSYTKSNVELCLFGTRGKVGIPKKDENGNYIFTDPKEKLCVRSHRVKSAINAPRERHSKKPEVVYPRIEELFGDVSRIELFARQRKPGWDAVGLDLDGTYIQDFLAKYQNQ